jgi:squalene monooxygenase
VLSPRGFDKLPISLERPTVETDRVVSELLQLGGAARLRSLGLDPYPDDIDAVPVHGYVVLDAGESVYIPFLQGAWLFIPS